MSEKRKHGENRTGRGDALLARGRSSRSNEAGRFERLQTEAFDDGWSGSEDDEPSRVETTLTAENAKTIISRNESPGPRIRPVGESVSGMRTRPASMASPGRPTRKSAFRPASISRRSSSISPKPRPCCGPSSRNQAYTPRRVQLGANTDCYQPIEKKLRITREVIEVLREFRHPLGITTKSHLVTRDIDLLAPMAGRSRVVVISMTTFDRRLARDMEPRASTPQRRLDAIPRTQPGRDPVIANVSPIIPGLTESRRSNASSNGPPKPEPGTRTIRLLRLSHELKDLFKEWLAGARPDRPTASCRSVRQTAAGKENDPRFGLRMVGEGPVADIMIDRFRAACRRFGPRRQKAAPLRTDLFKLPKRLATSCRCF